MHKKFSDGMSIALLLTAAIAFVFAGPSASHNYDLAADMEVSQYSATFTLASLIPSADDLDTWAQLQDGNFGMLDDAPETPSRPVYAENTEPAEKRMAHLALTRSARYDRDGNPVTVGDHHGS